MRRLLVFLPLLTGAFDVNAGVFKGPYGTIGKIPGKVSLQIVRDADSKSGAYRMVRNDSEKTVILERYAGKDGSVVPYCGHQGGSVRPCSELEIDSRTFEAKLFSPRLTTGLAATPVNGEEVAIRVQVNGEWVYLWEDTSISP